MHKNSRSIRFGTSQLALLSVVVSIFGVAPHPGYSVAAGVLECFAANDRYGAVVARSTEAHPGIRHRRALFQTPTYLLVFDDLAGTGNHTFDWAYHNRGKTVECEAAGKPVKLGKAFAGAEYLDHVRTGVTAEDIRVKFDGGEVTTSLLLGKAAGTEMFTADGPGESVLDRIPMVIATRRGTAAQFAAVIEPVDKKQPPAVSNVEWKATEGTVRIVVDRGAASDCFEIGRDGAVSLEVDKIKVLVGRPTP
jgi:hypothetical protein